MTRTLPFTGKARPLTAAAVEAAVRKLGVPRGALWALIKVETSGCGYLADRRPQIQFERHRFSGRTEGRFDQAAPDISSPEAGGYAGGAGEYERLARAIRLDRDAALESTSWGLGQVMGSHAQAAGFSNVREFVKKSTESEDAQLAAMAGFIAHERLDGPMREGDWATVARAYHGSGHADHDHDHDHEGQLSRWNEFFATHGTPDLRVREVQLGLMLLGYAPRGSVDGMYGPHTGDALLRFMQDEGMYPERGPRLTDPLLDRIRRRTGWITTGASEPVR
jgi:hypothetical protein